MVSLGWSYPRVDLYPMIANLGSRLLTVPVEDNEIRLLLRHMTTNAITRDLVSLLWKHDSLGFMAAQTTLRESCRIVLAGVNVVASQTRHCR